MPSFPDSVEQRTTSELEGKWKEYNESFDEPLSRNVWACEGNWRLVGNGERKSLECGRPVGFEICDSEEHDFLSHVDGKSFKGLVDVHVKHKSCFRYDCPVCYLSWAVHEAHAIDWKLEHVGKKWGLADHVVVSLADNTLFADCSLEVFSKVVALVVKGLKKRHVVGGCLIFHGFRYADFEESRSKGVPFGWRWSPHFHVLGFIYGRQAFYDAVPKQFLKDGLVVKLKDKRKTVFGTAWYQLNHASVRPDKKRFCVARWFGVGRSEKVDKMPKERAALKCRVCGRELVSAVYRGKKYLGKFKPLKECSKDDRRFYAERLENGEYVWLKRERVNNASVDY